MITVWLLVMIEEIWNKTFAWAFVLITIIQHYSLWLDVCAATEALLIGKAFWESLPCWQHWHKRVLFKSQFIVIYVSERLNIRVGGFSRFPWFSVYLVFILDTFVSTFVMLCCLFFLFTFPRWHTIVLNAHIVAVTSHSSCFRDDTQMGFKQVWFSWCVQSGYWTVSFWFSLMPCQTIVGAF